MLTTALMTRVYCEVPDCTKHYKSRANMLHHVRTHHKPCEVQSPLGNFPSANPARILFDDDDNSSTQGNSNGEVNSPKVRSIVSFQCGNCDMPFDRNEDAINHMNQIHPKKTPSPALLPPSTPAPVLTAAPASTGPSPTPNLQSLSQEVASELSSEEEVMIAAIREEEEAYEEICLLFEDSESEKIKEKLERLKNVMSKKTSLQKETTNTVTEMKRELQAANHNSNMIKEVTEKQIKELELARQETEKIKRDTKIVTDKLKKEKEAMGKELQDTREDTANINKENSDLKIQLSTKESIIQVLKEAATNNEEVEVIEPHYHQCNACEKLFKESQDLERHITAKHEEKQCTYCDTTCSNEEESTRHLNDCIDVGVANSTCNKCKENFTRQGFKRHKQNCHGVNNYIECSECGEMIRGQHALKKHTDKEHSIVVVKSKEVCRHWRRGHCHKGDRCSFSHVGHQDNSAATKITKVPACSNGSDCDWLRRGLCSYFHPRIGVQKPWVKKKESQGGQGGRQESRSQGSRQESRGQGGRQESRGQGGRQVSKGQGDRQETRSQGGRKEPRFQGVRQEARVQEVRQEARGQGRWQEDRSQVDIPRRSLIQPDRAKCKFDGRCERIPNCPWIHSMEDFPPLQRRRSINQRRQH